MRTTVDFDDDTAAAVNALRRERGIGLSDAVNELVRRGLLHPDRTPRFEQRTARLGIRIDVSDVAAALEHLEGPDRR